MLWLRIRCRAIRRFTLWLHILRRCLMRCRLLRYYFDAAASRFRLPLMPLLLLFAAFDTPYTLITYIFADAAYAAC